MNNLSVVIRKVNRGWFVSRKKWWRKRKVHIFLSLTFSRPFYLPRRCSTLARGHRATSQYWVPAICVFFLFDSNIYCHVKTTKPICSHCQQKMELVFFDMNVLERKKFHISKSTWLICLNYISFSIQYYSSASIYDAKK